jgi:hypothetical protein
LLGLRAKIKEEEDYAQKLQRNCPFMNSATVKRRRDVQRSRDAVQRVEDVEGGQQLKVFLWKHILCTRNYLALSEMSPYFQTITFFCVDSARNEAEKGVCSRFEANKAAVFSGFSQFSQGRAKTSR